jgi:hypothetical protein
MKDVLAHLTGEELCLLAVGSAAEPLRDAIDDEFDRRARATQLRRISFSAPQARGREDLGLKTRRACPGFLTPASP